MNLVGGSRHRLLTVSARAAKNYRKDKGLDWHKGARYAKGRVSSRVLLLQEQRDVHIEDAEIIYNLATETPWRLRAWRISDPAHRVYTSVRPSDKRLYRDERSDAFMANLPPFDTLPTEIQAVVGVKGDYSRSLILPFAMALEEPFLEEGVSLKTRRNRFLKIIGAYDHGYPSFYRRMVVVWMQKVAKARAGVTKMDEVPVAVRKESLKITQRQMRNLFHMSEQI